MLQKKTTSIIDSSLLPPHAPYNIASRHKQQFVLRIDRLVQNENKNGCFECKIKSEEKLLPEF